MAKGKSPTVQHGLVPNSKRLARCCLVSISFVHRVKGLPQLEHFFKTGLVAEGLEAVAFHSGLTLLEAPAT